VGVNVGNIRSPKISCLATVLPVRFSDVNKANSVKAKARQYKARGLQGQGQAIQGQGLTLQRIKSRS